MRLIRLLVFLLILNTFILAGFLLSQETGNVVLESRIDYANITNIVDGDTIDVFINNITRRVRLLGINTPEKGERGFEEATNFLKQFENKTIVLERTIEDKDKYERLLRYIIYKNRLLNEEILKKGLAHFYSYNKDKYDNNLLEAEEWARNNELGIWEKSKDMCSNCINLFELEEIEPEFIVLENKCNFECNLSSWIVKDDASFKLKLNFSILTSSQYQIDILGRVFNDAGDSFYLRDEKGLLVEFYRY